jgi:hypothetical protein
VSTYARAITWLTINMKCYHIRFSISNIIYIIIWFPSLLLRCCSSSQVLTIQERWRFELITNQLVIYSSHKPSFPRQGRLDHQWHFSSSRGITVMDRTTQGPPECQDVPWAHSSHPRHTPFSTSLPIWVYPSSNSITSFVVESYFIRLAKCESGLPLVINTWLLSMITIIANHNQVFTYISQVTGNHPTSTGLSMAKQLFDPDLTG